MCPINEFEREWFELKGQAHSFPDMDSLILYKRLNEKYGPPVSMFKTSPKTFISHSHADHDFVIDLAENMIRYDINVWYDAWQILPGDSFVQKIQDGISEAEYMIIVLSENSLNSKWVKEELNSGIAIMVEKGIFVIPLLIEKCPLPALLKHRSYIDFTDHSDKSMHTSFRSLIERLRPNEAVAVNWLDRDALYATFLLNSIIRSCMDRAKSWDEAKAELVEMFGSNLKSEYDMDDRVSAHFVNMCMGERKWLQITEFINRIPLYYNEMHPGAYNELYPWLFLKAMGQ